MVIEDQGTRFPVRSTTRNAEQLAGIATLIDAALAARGDRPVTRSIDGVELSARLDAYDFEHAKPMLDVGADLLDLLQTFAVRSDHPRYFGLFNPPALPAAIAGDLITAAVNPQLAVWGHAPAAAEIESKLVRLFGQWIWPDAKPAGTFTSGGSEANLTALLAALATRYPEWSRSGLPSRRRRPAIFVSSESHLAWMKLARMCGLGVDAVRLVPADDGLRLSGETLERAIQAADADPLMVVATAGTTAHGSIDDLAGIAGAGRAVGAHVHVDAAWAGGLLVHPGRRELLAGIEQADSATVDPHKWLAVPMGAGLYLARDWSPLAEAFNVDTNYMPSASVERRDSYIHSVQWSRRFIGGKLFMALASFGLDGYREMIDRQFELGDRLRAGLLADGWHIHNSTSLPLVCFGPESASDDRIRAIEANVVASGAAWISSVKLRGQLVLRACITSFETDLGDIAALLTMLRQARAASSAIVEELAD